MSFQVAVIDSTPELFQMTTMTNVAHGVQEFITRHYESVANSLGAVGASFVDRAKQLYQESLNNPFVIRAKAALMASKNQADPNAIRWLDTPQEITSAGVWFQRFIMAQPSVRSDYILQRAHGFSGTYFDREPGVSGEDHLDYRSVMSGVVEQEDENGVWMTQYLDPVYENDRPLTGMEKLAIVSAWDLLDLARSEGLDPTDGESQ